MLAENNIFRQSSAEKIGNFAKGSIKKKMRISPSNPKKRTDLPKGSQNVNFVKVLKKKNPKTHG